MIAIAVLVGFQLLPPLLPIRTPRRAFWFGAVKWVAILAWPMAPRRVLNH